MGEKVETEPRQILSGLQQHVSIDEMLNKQVIVFANLKPRKLAGLPSNGMVLCAHKEEQDEDQTKTIIGLLRPSSEVPNG